HQKYQRNTGGPGSAVFRLLLPTFCKNYVRDLRIAWSEVTPIRSRAYSGLSSFQLQKQFGCSNNAVLSKGYKIQHWAVYVFSKKDPRDYSLDSSAWSLKPKTKVREEESRFLQDKVYFSPARSTPCSAKMVAVLKRLIFI
ncbi:MAG: hypothetical protein D3922_05785, partial [Candidatus Electrothrix sp. AR1]|nr:hypothetical protein [Candidatus Electrothrix sp. AR1]